MMRRIISITLICISCFLVACDSADNNQSSESIIEQEVVSNVMEDDNNQYSETYVDDEQDSISINVSTNDIGYRFLFSKDYDINYYNNGTNYIMKFINYSHSNKFIYKLIKIVIKILALPAP